MAKFDPWKTLALYYLDKVRSTFREVLRILDSHIRPRPAAGLEISILAEVNLPVFIPQKTDDGIGKGLWIPEINQNANIRGHIFLGLGKGSRYDRPPHAQRV